MTTKKVKITKEDIPAMLDRHLFPDEIKNNIVHENLLLPGQLNRLHNTYPQHSGIVQEQDFMFTDKPKYAGLKGLREIHEILLSHGIDMGYMEERELFIKVYRFMVTKHVLNSINWKSFEKDSLFQLTFPQPEMISEDTRLAYKAAKTEEEKEQVVEEHMKKTNPHDGKQKLNKPFYEEEDGTIAVIEGSQHKYPHVELIFDQSTQNCFSFCTYCFRHAQVRGDEDMFIQKDVEQVHNYVKRHKEITDILITGGDAGYMPYERLKAYALPLIEDEELSHVRNLRLGTRVLTFHPDMILTDEYKKIIELFETLLENGIQVVFMSHFSTPREVLNISTIAAIRRLRKAGVTVKSQSPIMHHISMFSFDNGEIDVDKSAQNWIDLGNVLSTLTVGFHSMYCARPTGEHHYFTVPLKYINQIFSKVYRSLPSISRPSRYITMTSSAGKTSMLGETVINGEKVFVLKFNESRNMEWMDKVFLAKYDEKQNTIEKLEPYDTEKHFFEDELKEIEERLESTFLKKIEQ
jgi:L-lysine 2,3-aminomutase